MPAVMRTLAGAALAAAFAVSPALAMDMPARKPGLWEMKMSLDGGAAGQTMQQCIDAATDKDMRAFSSGINADTGNACQQSFAKTATGYTFEGVCAGGGQKSVSRGTVTGDFDRAYTIDVTTSGGVSGETKMQMAATWLGPCKAGQKPGDIVMPGGMIINIRQMQQMRGMMPGRPPGQ